jgi:predicted amidohydrolase
MNPLRLSLIQSHVHWEDAVRNLEHFTGHVQQLTSPTDVVVLPEMFATGFTMNTALALDMNSAPVDWMLDWASRLNALVMGSLPIRDASGTYNRLLMAFPNGTLQHSDKRHCFRMADEHVHYQPGTERKVVQWRGWNLLPLVCYDLRFPVWSRNRWSLEKGYEYDVVLYPANWPQRRSLAWQRLLPARAIENQCYCVGVNRVGDDGYGVHYEGHSGVWNYLGEALAAFAPEQEGWLHATLDGQALIDYRKAFPAGMDADAFRLENLP